VIAADSLPLPPGLGDVRVLVDGEPAPLFAIANSAGAEQVNFQAPFSISGRAMATVRVEREGVFSVSAEVPVREFQPGVFTHDGQRAIVVRHADNGLVTADAPLVAGEYAYFYATGLGPVDNPPATGAAGPAGPVAATLALPEVTLGGMVAEVLFAGLAPGFAGVYQVNVRVPEGILPGEAPLVVRQGGETSPATSVTVR
jgi:uncharacterized protein (TIGR03437 family)